MCNATLFIFYLCALFAAALAAASDEGNVSPAEASVLPYSLKATGGSDNGGRYKLLAVNPLNSQGVESELAEQHNMNKPQNHRSENPWERISVNYKNQLTALKPTLDEFGYYNTYGVAPQALHSDIHHFGGIGTVAVALPLSLLLILNLGMFLYLFVNNMSVLSAAAVGTHLRPPYNTHEYLRRDEYGNKYN